MLLPLVLAGCPHPTDAPAKDSAADSAGDTSGDSSGDTDGDDSGTTPVEVEPWPDVVAGITGPPNDGSIAATVRLELPGVPTELRAADLDSDGHDELLLQIDGALYVADVDAVAGTASIGDALFSATSFEVLGHHQILRRDTAMVGVEVATVRREQSGWAVSFLAYADDPGSTWPVGDLDGDGYPDLAALNGEFLSLLHAPSRVADSLDDSILHLWIFDYDAEVDQMVATGDRDGDGQEDLFVQWFGFVLGLPGPIEPQTNNDLTDVLVQDWATNGEVDAEAVGVVDDLDGDGRAEVLAPEEHLVSLAEDPGGPWTPYAAPSFRHVPVRKTGVLAAWGGGAGWWYGVPAPGQDRPDAEARVGTPELELMARLGAADPVDYAWTEGSTLYAVPAFGGLVGQDEDADGSLPPEDCDDGDPTVYPGAIDVGNGVDDDCDGDVDELGADLWSAAIGAADDRAGDEFVAWPGSDHARLSWPGATGLAIADLTAASQLVYADGPEFDLRLGDYDGDGQMDLAGATYGWSVAIAYGPADAPDPVGFALGWWSFSYMDLLGDVDDDGRDDLLIAPQSMYMGDHWMYYYTYQTLTFGTPERPPPLGEEPDLLVGVTGRVDANGDGVDDLLVYDSPTWALLPGPVTRDVPLDAGTAVSWARCSGCGVRGAAFDGDEVYDDLIATTSDEVLLYRGPMPLGAFDLATDAIATIDVGDHASSTAVVVTNAWVFLGRPDDEADRGVVYGFPLDGLGEAELADATWVRPGWEDGQGCGSALAVGDVDGDGSDELLVGCPGFEVEDNEGAILAWRLP